MSPQPLIRVFVALSGVRYVLSPFQSPVALAGQGTSQYRHRFGGGGSRLTAKPGGWKGRRRWELGVPRGVMLGKGVPPAGDTKLSGLDRWLGWRKHRGSPARQVDSWVELLIAHPPPSSDAETEEPGGGGETPFIARPVSAIHPPKSNTSKFKQLPRYVFSVAHKYRNIAGSSLRRI